MLPLPLALSLRRWEKSCRCHDTTSVQSAVAKPASLCLGGIHVVLCDGYGILTNDPLTPSEETALPTVGGEPWRSVSGSAITNMKW